MPYIGAISKGNPTDLNNISISSRLEMLYGEKANLATDVQNILAPNSSQRGKNLPAGGTTQLIIF